MNYQIEAAALYAHGMTCIPLKGKQPVLPKGYRDKMPVELQAPLITDASLSSKIGEPDGIGVLCGAYSGGFLALDFDLKNGHGEDFYTTWCVLVAGGNPDLYEKLIHVRTKNGGRHVYFRTAGRERKTEKLARGEDKKDWIELRSTGGYVIPPPSLGYEWIGKGWEGLSVLQDDEIDYLADMALCLNEYVPKDVPVWEPKNENVGPDSPLNRYDQITPGGDFLEQVGFKRLHGNSTQVHFNRPGAKNKAGVDATWYIKENQIRIWSTSTGIVHDTDRNYRPYQLLTFLKYGGDFSRAAREVALEFTPKPVQSALVRPLVKEPVKAKEPMAPGPDIINQVRERALEKWVRAKMSAGVSLEEPLYESAIEAHLDLDPNRVREFVKKFYEENEDSFGEDQIKLPYKKAQHFLKKHYIIRRNSVLLTTTILHRKTGKDSNLNLHSIWNNMQEVGIKIGLQQVKSMVEDPQYFEMFDPFEDYFRSLGDRGKGHIEKLASYVETGCPEFWQKMFRKAMIRTVAGAIGGFPNREAIVLCSEKQKIGKTWFVSNLSPWGENQYFSSEPIVQNKDQMFRICQNMIYLLDEIGQKATNEKHSDYLKMLLSKQSVNERRVYDVDTTNLTRKVTFWATTNLPYLYQGQNTRWISIPVKSINHNYNNRVTGAKEVDINSVWAEAYAAYMNGEDFELDSEDLVMQERLNQDWIMGSEAMGLVATYVRKGMDWKTAEQILNTLSPANPNIIRRITVSSLKAALQAHGIPHKVDIQNGYRLHLFQCIVEENPSFREEESLNEPPF